MGKYINKRWKVVVGTVDLSDHAFDVQIADEKDRIEVSGFTTDDRREYLQGLQEQSVTVQYINDFGTGSVFQTNEPLYDGGSIFAFYVQPLGLSGASTANDNPIFGGSAQIYTFPVGGALNERAELTVEYRCAPGSKFTWGTATP